MDVNAGLCRGIWDRSIFPPWSVKYFSSSAACARSPPVTETRGSGTSATRTVSPPGSYSARRYWLLIPDHTRPSGFSAHTSPGEYGTLARFSTEPFLKLHEGVLT